jgi:Secretion system C-terminal sorting domain
LAITFSFEQNYPNPFSPTTVIGYSPPEAQWVELCVYDPLGSKVRTLLNGFLGQTSGAVTLSVTGLAAGVYLYRLVAGNLVQTRKLYFLR